MVRILCAWLIFLMPLAARAQEFETSARAAYVYDMTTQTVILSKNAHTALPPASMSKLMTLYLTFEAIRDGRLDPQTKLAVSQHAMDYGGSTMFLNTRDRVSVDDLIKGVIVLSGNDASAVLAEALSPDGTERGFARLMTDRAKELGLTNSTFANSNGWPDPIQRMSMHDLARLAQLIIEEFPDYYRLFSMQEFQFDDRAPDNIHNRNPLLGLGIGADGLKTGHTQEAGYGLVGSAKQGERRIIFAITGIETAAQRAEEAERIVNWAFRQFAARTLVQPGQEVVQANVWGGQQATVGLAPIEGVEVLVSISGGDEIKAEVIYQGPITAPIESGTELGMLRIVQEGLMDVSVPLYAKSSVEQDGFMGRLGRAAGVVIRKISPQADLPPALGGA